MRLLLQIIFLLLSSSMLVRSLIGYAKTEKGETKDAYLFSTQGWGCAIIFCIQTIS